MTRLPVVPASFFGIVLGIAGVASGWRLAHGLWGYPSIIGEALFLLAGVVWAVLMLLYIGKWVTHPDTARAELEHPVQCCFVGLAGVATMLMAGGVLPYGRAPAGVLLTLGVLFTLGFAIWRTGLLWHGGRDPGATTPVLYLPAVAGSFVTGTTLAGFGLPDWGQLAFGAGIFSWLAIESVLLHRLYTAPEMAPALRPTLGVQLAPPVVGAVAYLSVSGGAPDLFARALIGYGLLQGLLLLRLLPWIRAQGFTPGFWAFSFGVTSLANAPLIMVGRGEVGAISLLAGPLFIVSNITVALLAVSTLRLLLIGALVPPLRPAAPKA